MNQKNQTPKRIRVKNLIVYFLATLNLERGIFYTIRELIIRPGKCIRTFLFEDRSKIIKPLNFLFLFVTIATFLTLSYADMDSNFLTEAIAGFKEGFMNPRSDLSEIAKEQQTYAENFLLEASKTIKGYLNLFFLANIPFMSIASFYIFKKSNYFFAEHLVINSYLYAMITLFYIVLLPIISLNSSLGLLLISITFVYNTWVYHKVFQNEIKTSIGKSMLVYVISQVFTIIFASFLMIVYVLLYFKPPI